MPTFDLRFPPEVRLALHRLAEGFGPELTHPVALRAAVPHDADEDFSEVWLNALADRVDDDVAGLRHLLATQDFGAGPVTISEDEALAALRGFSVLRMAIRVTILRDIPDSDLESGEVDHRRLAPAARHAYACYGALGEIQAAICDGL